MKKLSYIPLVIFWLWAAACSTDFRLTASFKEITVVYGLLSQNETVHYIRIHRAFLDEKTSALVIAQNPDSIYYPDILDVTVTELKSGKVYLLERVDGDTVNPPIAKDTGTFASHPNILYRFKAPLDDASDYKLTIVNTKTGKVLTATTGLVQDFTVLRPFPNFAVNWVGPTDFTAIWNLAGNSRIYDLTIRLQYHIASVSAPLITLKDTFVDIPIFHSKNFTEPQPRYEIPGDVFFQGVQFRLDPDPSIVRYADSLQFIFTVGTVQLSDFINYNKAQTGLVQNEISGTYTNIIGGYGIFAARFTKTVHNVPMNNQSIDSLGCGTITGDLGFAPSQDLVHHPNWPFCD